ncbi:MAG: DUF6431 domain-containing protein [Chloroflexota bacterium]|nr:DUF6431 domain-containing protein [Chloroflexota bacterium]
MVIVQHFPSSAKQYAEAVPFPGRSFIIPHTCPHPDCQASGCLIRWGTYERSARTGDIDYHILIQRIRCKVCGHTHSLLPDFLHPYRHYVIHLLQHVASLYLTAGLGVGCLVNQLPGLGPARSTVREWIGSFAYGAGHLLLDFLVRQLLALDPLAELPDTGAPAHLNRVSDATKRLRLERAYRFWLRAERLYAQLKLRSPRLHFAADQLLPFLLHWLQSRALPPRLFWNPALSTTPTTAF